MFYKTVIQPERDDFAGWHCIVIDAVDNTCVHVTDSYARLGDALAAARDWLDRKEIQRCETA